MAEINSMNCPDCLRKHIAAALSYAKEILNGHGSGGNPDHRADFAGEIVNAEHHAEHVSGAIATRLRDFRHNMDKTSWTPALSDTNILRGLWSSVPTPAVKPSCCGGNRAVATATPPSVARTNSPFFVRTGRTDIVIPFKSGNSKNDDIELRYLLRSIERKANVRKVFIAAKELPGWMTGVEQHIKVNDSSAMKQVNIYNAVKAAAADERVSDDFVFCADDFVFLRPVNLENIETLSVGSDMLTAYTKDTWWHKVLRATGEQLKAKGYPTINYEAHAPVLFNKAKFAALDAEFDFQSGLGICMISAYLNKYNQQAVPMNQRKGTFEAKTTVVNIARACAGKQYLSYNDSGFAGATEFLSKILAQKSRYELPAPGTPVSEPALNPPHLTLNT